MKLMEAICMMMVCAARLAVPSRDANIVRNSNAHHSEQSMTVPGRPREQNSPQRVKARRSQGTNVRFTGGVLVGQQEHQGEGEVGGEHPGDGQPVVGQAQVHEVFFVRFVGHIQGYRESAYKYIPPDHLAHRGFHTQQPV
eukprot:CAMPEP_0173322850 /NCGR_PEP_ID=MMETSP1143-20121109/30203_1 /TAXON_ID=483371 /ORGANISM="non described non described, Strain CCMP2298" /LENGTH=139 /DNA_ID=CAMNT_0014266775 /DNA_START=425 /DNA_END=843 /DNA_ORIENTATION=-